MFAEFDAAVMGRKTYELVGAMEGDADALPGMEAIAFSRTLPGSPQIVPRMF
jgi:dihydrofolate reductase